MLLKTALKDAGSSRTPEEFIDLLADVFNAHFRGQTVEDVLCNPTEGSLVFVAEVRRRSRLKDLDEELICRTALNCRKKADERFRLPCEEVTA